MNNFLAALIPAAVLVLGAIPSMGVVLWTLIRERARSRQSPLTRNLMRTPGYSLRRKIEKIDEELYFYVSMTFVFPLLAYSAHVSESYFAQRPESIWRFVFTFALGCIGTGVFGFVLAKKLFERKQASLGLEGELATGDELNQLMLDGCRVFHDVPFPYGNIDHVVVSRSGVYSVNSKVYTKPRSGRDRAEVRVDLSAGVLYFADRSFDIPADQLTSEAKWLGETLTSAVGQPVTVEPILALPGWFIKERRGRGPVFVINPRKPRPFFVQNREKYSPSMIQQIAHQLEQLCGDVEPSFKDQSDRWEDAT